METNDFWTFPTFDFSFNSEELVSLKYWRLQISLILREEQAGAALENLREAPRVWIALEVHTSLAVLVWKPLYFMHGLMPWVIFYTLHVTAVAQFGLISHAKH